MSFLWDKLLDWLLPAPGQAVLSESLWCAKLVYSSLMGVLSPCCRVLGHDFIVFIKILPYYQSSVTIQILSSSGPGPRSGPGQVPDQVQKVQGLMTKALDLG